MHEAFPVMNLVSEGTSTCTTKEVLWGMVRKRVRVYYEDEPAMDVVGTILTPILLTEFTFRKREFVDEM